MNAVFIDVSELPPPEPMMNILSALTQLPLKHYLKIKHSRIPYPLFPRLTENNWCYQYGENTNGTVTNGEVTLYIYRNDEHVLFEQIDDAEK